MQPPDDPGTSQFTEFDYDFSEVKSKPEMQACEFYEYARESRAVVAEVKAIRKQRLQNREKTEPVKFGPRVQNLLQGHALMTLSFCSEFPNTPWQCLSDGYKQMVSIYVAAFPHVWRYATTCQNPPLSFALSEPGTTTLDMWKKQYRERLPAVLDIDPIKFGFFSVNLKYDHAVLIEEFTKCLRQFESKPMFGSLPVAKKMKKTKPPGRRGHRDALNALGAMRLRYLCKKFAAAKKKMMPLREKPNGMFYGHRESFNRACDASLRHFQKIFGWLDPAQPIHFTRPEQK